MSLARLIYYGGIVGAWAAFVGWLLSELLFGRFVGDSFLLAVLMAALVAAAIGGGLSQVGGLVNLQWLQQLKRLGPGLLGGLLGGFIGALLGNGIYALLGQSVAFLGFVGRVLGWTLMGVGIGVVEGIYDLSLRKIRNGAIGGALGGFLGGLLFNPISWLIGGAASSRATGFVILGACIGLFIALVQVVLKEAWLTVEQGFRTGRQLILSQAVTTLGTSEKASLIFIAYGAKGVEPVHLQIVRQPGGKYVVQDNRSRSGTYLNGQPLQGAAWLRDGDVIQFGVNVVRFRERVRPLAPGVAVPAQPTRPSAVAVPVAVAMPQAVTTQRPPTGYPPQAVAVQATPPPPRPVPPSAVSTVPPSAIQAVPYQPPPAPPRPTPAQAVPAVPPSFQQPPTPAPPASVPAKPVPQKAEMGECPTCERKTFGIPGRRRCENCGRVF